ncbi:MAG: RdgB/HAM1 family non-canonical purine NTP pyrophosphatase [candidate division KSB1 bacterium]|nr:RdgB/HAM1 family non-canonical purine NTP pyrophosphatase [candidate division KSB1 bacterium]MDZ7274715.1 RdgB/HAM1 family non-canonical purine NTP pyrophosphatase [candidate division KSB1 bacterium]MDZ7285540.1 RdgB/HAM1 family non-canonical purine NTP pyrophosphatase [candidate division KSB1 bacterium]MDZ7298572.1 RdgB/HAM1 family non-canonical purine NTP pyrophosphatase [candidate division KSB1 bacterium]MDZ7309421.1 RdgB/HAM1 family non-canonical purine NTP pyrophosphatase [candidate div
MPLPPARVVLATHNRDKIREIQEALRALPVTILSLDDFPDLPEVAEDGDTLEENARKKAVTLHHHTGLPALADDTGLFVAALGGRPGVYSSRYAGPGASYQDNVCKLLAEMQAVPPERRNARFRTVMAFTDGNTVHFVEGSCDGHLALAPRGEGGFGYDSIFIVAGSERTFAEMSLREKNAVSHRGRALAAARQLLKRYFRVED